jgi:spermidine synthase
MAASNLEILAYDETPLGLLCLRRRELLSQPGTVVTEVTLNHEFLMSSLNTLSERELSNGALSRHDGEDLKVLVGGLGLGYTAHEVLKSKRVASVEVVEFLPQVIDWMERDLFPVASEIRSDARLKVVSGDVYGRLSEPPEALFDLILIDVDHSPEENLDLGSNPFYTESGLKAARRHLADDGVLAVWSYAADSPFATALRGVFEEVTVAPVTFNNVLIDESATDYLFFARGWLESS